MRELRKENDDKRGLDPERRGNGRERQMDGGERRTGCRRRRRIWAAGSGKEAPR